MKKTTSISIGLLAVLSFLGTTAVLSENCYSIIIEKDTLKVGDTFFVYPLNVTIDQHLSTGTLNLVAVNANYAVYKATSSGTVVFENCDGKTTVRIFPRKTPFSFLRNLIRFRTS